MKYSFICCGHENITCRHKTTLEFTKDSELSLKGDCIVGVKADFSIKEIKRFIKSSGNNRKITITIETIKNDYNNKNFNEIKYNANNNKIINNKNNNITIEKNKTGYNITENKIIEKINAEINLGFDSDKEMVIRKGDFADKRTFAIKADKAACELNAALLGFLKGSRNKIEVIVEKA